MKLFLLVISIFFFGGVNLGQSVLKLPSIFSDNMVLQQDSEVPIWGWGSPNSEIMLKAGWDEEKRVKVEADSTWDTVFRTPKPGGPYNFTIIGEKNKIEFTNILIGEVWLCSGQSNMEMPLAGWPPKDIILNSKSEILNSENNKIRFFTVSKNMSVKEKSDCIGAWQECNPKTSASFSATAYYFGKKLYDELKIPIGLIHSSWGGTPAEAWTSRKYLSHINEFDSILKNIELSIPASKELDKWLTSFPKISMHDQSTVNKWSELEFHDENCKNYDLDHSKWLQMTLPTLWERTALGEFDGVVWFRKTVQLNDSWINEPLVIELGPIDDFDQTFINGIQVGAIEEEGNWKTVRKYSIQKDINNQKKMVIAVRVNDTRGGGGIYGSVEQLKLINSADGSEISLSGKWHYLPVAEFRGMEYYVFGSEGNQFNNRPSLPIDISSNTPTLLYNSMIAPLVPFKIKGIIWYQGEANTGNPRLYERLFPTLISNWRDDFGQELPFYFVQIAPYDYGEFTKSERLRDAQRKTLVLDNTGMAVTLDIGNIENIHPANKKDVGERLALWGLNKLYGRDEIVYSGPLYKSLKIKKNIIELEFENIGSGLEIRNGENQFIIAGADQKFISADVKIIGSKIQVWSSLVSNPLAVRYSWHNNSAATLFNLEGLPASSFRTDDWD